ncbi:MAG TPA: hypothetical protein VM095_15420 [Pyrinomonadaceae bacterium]|nr:hypothetical protein [Pyrinomonadaceae bacterium]
MEAVIEHERVATYRTSAEILKLVREFEACTLAHAGWTHHAHLIVALWYLMRHDYVEATRLIRNGIKSYNRASGIETTRTGGYHETITLFYTRVIRKFLSAANPDCTLTALARSLLDTCGDKNLPLEYYSHERLMSWEARVCWLEPDLKALD